MSARLAYGDILRGGRSWKDQRVMFVRYRDGNATWFLGMTVKPSGRPLGGHKVGSVEQFPVVDWKRDE